MVELLAELLVTEAGADPKAVAAAERRAREQGSDLASQALAAGAADEQTISRLLSRLTGFPALDLSRCVIESSCADLLPQPFAAQKQILVAHADAKQVVVALRDPREIGVIDDLRFRTARRVLPHVAIPVSIDAAVEALYRLRGEQQRFLRGSAAPAGAAREQLELVRPGDSSGPRPGAPDPLAGELPVLQGTQQPPPLPSGPRPILVVDDDVDMRTLALKVLKRLDLELIECGDGEEALELARRRKPALILLDAMLPGKHGFDVCRALKGDPATARIPVLMASGVYVDWRVQADAKASFGADGFLAKPFRVEELESQARSLISGTASDRLASPEAVALAEQGLGAARVNQLDEAVEKLSLAAVKQPFWAEVHFYLGAALEKRGDTYDAIAAYERATELRPDLFAALKNLAGLYERLGFARSARGVWEKALSYCPTKEGRKKIRERMIALLQADDS